VSGDGAGRSGDFSLGFVAGTRIAGYRLEEQIGRGGMAVVFRARDERLGRLVALKILAPVLAADDEFRRRFIRESQAAAAVDDPHIVPVFEAGEADGILFIAMRYVPGGDAESLVTRGGPLSAARAAGIISQVATALDAAHGTGLVHRDVKPANMLVDAHPDRPDHVYLSDFGLSKGTVSSAGLTQAGQFLGTLEYISPEQIEGRPVDGQADEYALACAAFDLLTGAPPFRRDEPTSVMYAQLSEPPPPLTSRRPDLPSAVDDVMVKALAKAPGDRYASCREFADALRRALGLQPYHSGPGVIPVADHPPTQIALPTAGVAAEPELATHDMPTRGAAIPPSPATATDVNQPVGNGPSDGNTPSAGSGLPNSNGPSAGSTPGGWLAQRRRRVIAAAAVAAVVVVAVVIAVVLSSGSPGHASAGHTAARHSSASVLLTVRSASAPLTGYVYVVYQGGKLASAQVQGEIKGATSGEVAQLYAQQFPFNRAPVPAGSVILRPAGKTATYTFSVTPSLATRYKVELFSSSTAATALASSPVSTIYVVAGGTSGNGQKCGRPVCHESYAVEVFVPAAALSAEFSKQVYAYGAVSLSATKAPGAPKSLTLNADSPHVSALHRISADEYGYTITFAYRVGNDGYATSWNACEKDTETVDGLGLPGSHGCGDSRILASAAYLG
jgi:serine/threonine protein kinase